MTQLLNDMRNLAVQVDRLQKLVNDLIKINEPKPLEADPAFPYGNEQSEIRIQRFIRQQARRLTAANGTYASAVKELESFKFKPGIDPDLFYIKTQDDR